MTLHHPSLHHSRVVWGQRWHTPAGLRGLPGTWQIAQAVPVTLMACMGRCLDMHLMFPYPAGRAEMSEPDADKGKEGDKEAEEGSEDSADSTEEEANRCVRCQAGGWAGAGSGQLLLWKEVATCDQTTAVDIFGWGGGLHGGALSAMHYWQECTVQAACRQHLAASKPVLATCCSPPPPA